MYSVCSQEKWASGSMFGIIPQIGIHEFMDKLKNEEYDPDHIYDVWSKMEADPNTKQLIANNEECGVCKKGYTNKPF